MAARPEALFGGQQRRRAGCDAAHGFFAEAGGCFPAPQGVAVGVFRREAGGEGLQLRVGGRAAGGAPGVPILLLRGLEFLFGDAPDLFQLLPDLVFPQCGGFQIEAVERAAPGHAVAGRRVGTDLEKAPGKNAAGAQQIHIAFLFFHNALHLLMCFYYSTAGRAAPRQTKGPAARDWPAPPGVPPRNGV